MASITLRTPHDSGVTVTAYLASNWAAWLTPPTGAPVGSSTTSGTTGADGSVTLTGLADGTQYYAHTNVGGHRYIGFRTDATAASAGSGVPAGGAAGEVLTKNSGVDGDADWLEPPGDAYGGLRDPYDRIDDGTVQAAILTYASSRNANAALTTTTYDGSGQTTHPDVVYFPRKWNGWHYWMVHTPYPGADSSFENPSILVSNDGDTWQEPVGLTNPLVPKPPGGADFNSDGCFVKSLDGLTLHVLYREAAGVGTVKMLSSTDGVTWAGPVSTGVTGAGQLSPSVVYRDGQWLMFVVDNSGGTPRPITRRTATSLLGPWSAPVACTKNGLGGNNPWHIQVVPWGERLIFLLNDSTKLLIGESTDGGLTQNYNARPLLYGRGVGYWDEEIYRSAMVPAHRAGIGQFDLFYAGKKLDSSNWRLGRSTVDLMPPPVAARAAGWRPAPEGVTAAAAFTLNTLYAVPFDTLAQTLAGLAINVTTLGASSVVRVGIYLDNNGAPGDLLYEFPTFDASATGVKALTSQTITVPAGRKWIAAVAQVAGCSLTGVSGTTNQGPPFMTAQNSTNAVTTNTMSYSQTGVTGALPNPFGAVTPNVLAPRFGLSLA